MQYRLAGWVDPAALIRQLPEEDRVWLDGGGEGVGHLGYASHSAPAVTASVADGTVRVHRAGRADEVRPGTIFDHLAAELASVEVDGVPPGDGFALGWVGWFGYEAGAAAMGVRVHASAHPDAAFLFVDRAVRFDPLARSMTVLALDSADPEQWLAQVNDAVERTARAGGGGTEGAPRGPRTWSVDWRHTDDEYRVLLDRCQDAIRAGDAYQLCLTDTARMTGRFDPLETHLALRRTTPTHHSALLQLRGVSLVSASPEQFLRITRQREAVTRPIKGTRRRGETPEADALLAAELLASEKERAENLMIVDLMRNDFARVCTVGSVATTALYDVETYPAVHQLVSTVTGRLGDGIAPVDVIRACFPAGSMTGTPKRSAMDLLHDLEAGPRGPYAGCFGYLSITGTVDLAMTIRTLVLDASGASLGSGGGVTALSVADDELAEKHLKAAPLLAALTPAEAGAGPRARP